MLKRIQQRAMAHMNYAQSGIQVEVFNVKDLTKKLDAVHEISEDTMVLRISETWLQKKGTVTRELLDETEEVPEGELVV